MYLSRPHTYRLGTKYKCFITVACYDTLKHRPPGERSDYSIFLMIDGQTTWLCPTKCCYLRHWRRNVRVLVIASLPVSTALV